MKILVVGSGGREHAIAWRLAQDAEGHELYCAPGNAGTAAVAANVPLAADDIAGIAAWARENKPDLVAKAKEVYALLKQKYTFVTWDDSGNIGKRYKKQDEIGTPKCIVIDFQTLEDGTVTVRDRDTAKQIRVNPEEL